MPGGERYADESTSAPGSVMAAPARSRKHRSSARPARATARRRQNRRTKSQGRKTRKRWSRRVTEHSNALDLRRGVFTLRDPKKIAASLKRSAQASKRRKADPYRSALSMLTFYINRAGKNLPASRKRTLMRAKDELRGLYGRK